MYRMYFIVVNVIKSGVFSLVNWQSKCDVYYAPFHVASAIIWNEGITE